MGKISRNARLLFILMWTLADDEGRLRGNSRMLASLLFPYDNDAPGLIDAWISELISEQCVVAYKVGAATYVQICNWLIHQKIDKPSKSKIPPFDESSRILANPRGGIKDQGSKDQGSEEGRGTACTEPQSDSLPADDALTLIDLDDLDPDDSAAAPSVPPVPAPALPPEPPEPSVLIMPLAGGKEFGIVQSQIDEWAGAYPGVDIVRQLAAMRQWCLANPTRQKTQRGVLAFCNNWLSKEQNKAPQARASPGRQHPQDKAQALADRITGRDRNATSSIIDINPPPA
jgi:hypothetical protein